MNVVEHRPGYRLDGDRFYRGNCVCGWQAKKRDQAAGFAERRALDHFRDKTGRRYVIRTVLGVWS